MPITVRKNTMPDISTPHRRAIHAPMPVTRNHNNTLRAPAIRRQYIASMATIMSSIIINTATSPDGSPMIAVSVYLTVVTKNTTAHNAAVSTRPLMPSRYSTKNSAMYANAEPVSFCARISPTGRKIMSRAFI